MGSRSYQVSTDYSIKFGRNNNNGGGGGGGNTLSSAASSSSSSPSSSSYCFKRSSTSTATNKQHPPRCQVEGCFVDLSGVKAYYGRHKVCGLHSKSPMVIVAGMEQRFCQQCSRFHRLAEFDQGKRSCRRRLADHNERRRKPSPAVLSSQIGLPSSPFTIDNCNSLRGFLMNFSYPQATANRDLPMDSNCVLSLLSAGHSQRNAPVTGNQNQAHPSPPANTTTTTTASTSFSSSNISFDKPSIMPCNNNLWLPEFQ